MDIGPRLHNDRSFSPDERRRRQALALTALMALVLGAFATGGYLYQQSNRPAKTESTNAPPEERSTGTAGVDSAARPAEDSSAQPRESASPTDPTNADRGSTPAEATASAAAQEHELTGAWTIATRVDNSRVEGFRGLRLGYVVNLRQEGDRITGSGRKVAENGSPLQSAAQTPITLAGTIKGDQVRLTFRERGARRESTGEFVLRRESDNSLRGSFSSDAARTAGAAEVYRR